MIQKRKKVTEKIVSDLFLGLFPVQALSAGLPAINTLLSGLIIGSAYGSAAMAAQGFTSTLTILVAAVGTLFSKGSQLLCGQTIGKGDKDGTRRIFNSTLIPAVILGFLLALLSVFGSPTAARILGASGEAFQPSAAMIRGLGIGIPFTILNTCLLPYLQLDGKKKLASVSIIVLVAVNIGFSLLNVFVLKLGMFGIGLAFSISAIASFSVSIPHFLFRSKSFCLSPADTNLRDLIAVVKMGIPAALSPALLAVKSRLLNTFLLAAAGTIGVSAYAAASNIANAVGSTLESGYSGTVLLISSTLIGERDCESLAALPRTAVKRSYHINLIAYLSVFLCAKPLAILFGATMEELPIFILAFRLRNLYFVSNPFKTIPLNMYHSLGKVSFSCVMNVINSLCFTLMIGWASIYLGSTVLFVSPVLTEVLTILLLYGYYRVVSGRFPHSVLETVYIPESFYIHSDNRVSACIRTPEEAAAASEQINRFCLEKGMAAREAYHYALCVEEICMDTLLHCLPDRREEGTIDLRMYIDHGEATLIFRDNCKDFDINSWLALHAEEDPARSLGLKLVKSTAASMVQTATLGLNMLVIRSELDPAQGKV